MQLAHGEQRVLASTPPRVGQRQQVQRCRTIVADVIGIGEIAVERDARGRQIIEHLDDEADGVLVEVGLQHAVAQHGDDGRLAGDIGPEAGFAAFPARRLKGIYGAGYGGR